MRRHDISGLPVVAARRRARSASSPTATFASSATSTSRCSAMMTTQPHHGPRGHQPRQVQGAAAQEPHREAAGRRRRGHAEGPHHHQGHREGAGSTPTRPRTTSVACACGAAVGTGADRAARVEALLAAGADVIVVDTAHGHSKRRARGGRRHPRDVPQGRRSSPATSPPPRAPLALAKAGADAVKVGIGPGSICTTRVVAGVGVPQITAISDCAQRARQDWACLVIADGGIKYSGDVAKAIAAGAHIGHDRQPVRRHRRGAGRDHPVPGPQLQGLPRHGVHRRHARGQQGPLLPEPRSPATPSWSPRASRAGSPIAGRCRSRSTSSSAGLQGRHGLLRLRAPSTSCAPSARFVRTTPMGLRESHVHDVIITKEAPNYRVEQ